MRTPPFFCHGNTIYYTVDGEKNNIQTQKEPDNSDPLAMFKYTGYARTTQVQYDVHSIHSGNLYQIFTYVKNKAAQGGEVSGMLLYAGTDEDIQPNQTYHMSGNTISVKTLNLDCDFTEIQTQLNTIADEFMS